MNPPSTKLGSSTRIAALLAAALLLSATAGHAQINVLHVFDGYPTDGSQPHFGAPVIDGSSLYGMTYYGGANDAGAVFKMNTSGSGYTLLRSFSSSGTEANSPQGGLTLSGSTLYGMTQGGGADYAGTIFKMNTDGSAFSVLHSFADSYPSLEGRGPFGALTLSGSTLYGMTGSGGDGMGGTLFKMNTDGSGFNLLHSFVAYGPSDGGMPFGTLTLSGSTLYGTTAQGGASGVGTVFSVQTDGSGFNLLHSFSTLDGGNPMGTLTLVDSTLYGITEAGGAGTKGTIYQVNTDGTGFNLLHEFAGGSSDGSTPRGSMVLSGSKLFGTTTSGGTMDYGTLFAIGTNGTGFAVMDSFEGTNGNMPQADLAVAGSTLYGMASVGGGPGNAGVVFSTLAIPEPSTYAMIGAGALGLLALRRRRS